MGESSGGHPAAGHDEAGARTIVRRAPLVAAAACMAAGIIAGRYAPLPVGLWAAAGAAGLAGACVGLWRRRRGGPASAALAAAIFAAGAMAAALAWRRVAADHVVRCSPARGDVLATIRGTVVSAPRIRRPRTTFWRPPTTGFLLAATGARRTDGTWRPVTGTVRVTIREPARHLAAGDEVELLGRLRRPRGPQNPGQHDWRAADRRRGILVRFVVPGADGARRIEGNGWSLSRLWRRLRGLARRHVGGLGAGGEATLVEALVLGERDPALRRLNQAMVEAGVAHFLSISGLHLGIFLGFVYGLCRVVGLHPRRSAGVALVVLAAYVLLAEPRPPLLRAAVMAAAVCVAAMSGRAVTTANALAAAAVVLLAADPLGLFRPGFQLSFAIVGGILLLHEPIRRLVFGPWLRRRGLTVFRSDQRLRRWMWFTAADWGMGLVSLSLAAYAAAAPLVACHFGLFSPYAPLLSLLLLPLTVAVLVPAYLSMALALPMPNLSSAIGSVALDAAGVMGEAVMLTRRLPGLSFDLFAFPVWLAVLCYAALVLWARGGRRLRPAAAAATLAVAAGVVLTQRPAPAPDRGRLHVLDVGHGSMALLHAPDGRTWLFDAGSIRSRDAYQDVLRPFLRARRLPGPEAVFVSHANLDHYNALPSMLAHRPPERLYVNEFFGAGGDAPPGPRRLLHLAAVHGVEVVRLRRGDVVDLGGGARVEVLWPPPREQAPELDVNDRSLVLRVVCAGCRAVFPGDAGELVQETLARDAGKDLACEVMVLPHHGGLTGALAAFLRAAGAELLIQSSSYRVETSELERVLGGRRRFVTFREGWIAVDLSPHAPRVATMRQGPAAGAPPAGETGPADWPE